MIFDHLSAHDSYYKHPIWHQAFDFLTSIDSTIEDGEYKLDGDKLFARAMKYDTTTPEGTVLEAHQKYADIQILLSGSERIGVYHAANLEIETPYCDQKDVVFFKKERPFKHSVVLEPGRFGFFLPLDAHMPMLKPDAEAEPEQVHKVVVKVALEELFK